MIHLKSILPAELQRFKSIASYSNGIRQWKREWFGISRRLRQALFVWAQNGVISDDDREDVTGRLDDLDEFFKAAATQANKLMGGGV